MTKASRYATATLALSFILSFVTRIERLYKWIPQPAQDRLWHILPDLSSAAFIVSLVLVIGLMDVGAPKQ